jgi:hypothetical protein
MLPELVSKGFGLLGLLGLVFIDLRLIVRIVIHVDVDVLLACVQVIDLVDGRPWLGSRAVATVVMIWHYHTVASGLDARDPLF